MTIKEIAEIAGVSKSTARRGVLSVFPEKLKKGETTELNHAESVKVMNELRKKNFVSPIQNEQVAVQNEPRNNEVSEYVTKNDLIDFAKTIVQETISGFLPLLNGATKQIEFKQDYFSVKGYSSKQGQQLNFSEAVTLGKIASKLSRERGLEIRTIEDERFGFVNSYHVDILDEVFRM